MASTLTADSPAVRHLYRLPMVRAGATEIARDEVLVGSTPTRLSPEGEREVERITRQWEWAATVVSSPALRARQTAAILAGGRPVILESDLRPRHLGSWEGRAAEELREIWPAFHQMWRAGDVDFELMGAEPLEAYRSRIDACVERLLAVPHRSILLVSHQSVIRAIAARLAGSLPAGRPWPAEMVLLTRQDAGHWRLGRRSSDPEALRSPLERNGLSGRPAGRVRERHVAHLQLGTD